MKNITVINPFEVQQGREEETLSRSVWSYSNLIACSRSLAGEVDGISDEYNIIIVAVIGRSLLQYRLTGDYGIRTAGRSSSVTAKFSSVLIVIVFIGAIIISALSTFAEVESGQLFGSYNKFVGVLFCLGGIILTCVSQVKMGKEWRMGVDSNEKTELVTHGIYSTVRNPIYTGVMLFGLGLVVLVSNIYILVLAVLGYLSIELHVRKVEESYLNDLHGQAFIDYKNSTGRYILK